MIATPIRRRLLLAGGATLLAAPAVAQTRHPAPHKPHAAAAAAPPTSPASTPLGPLEVEARWAYIMDYNTQATLLDKDGTVEMPPSSMTKLMTAYIVYSMLKTGRLKLDQLLPVSERAWRMGGSKMFVPLGGNVAVEDLVRGMIVQSGNDACIVLAEAIAGSEEGFVALMNKQAQIWGLATTHFTDATGWPDPDHHMSCKDIATVAWHLIHDFPEYYHYDSEKTFKYNNIEQGNRNPLVQKGIADGMKTGHTEAGGYGLVVSAERNGRRVIVVLNGLPSMHARGEEGERLLDWAFREFEDVTLFTANAPVAVAKVWLGVRPDVALVAGHDLMVTLPRNWRDKAQISLQYATPVPAPIAKGAVLGKLVMAGDGVPALETPLLAASDVPLLGLPGRAMAVLSHYVTGS